MADAEIQIIISAQDKISAQLKSIEGKITGFAEQNKKATEKLTQSWDQGTQGLLAIGNAASTVDNIFSSLTNLTLRLENANERLANAQDRVTDSAKDLKRSQRDLERAQRELAAAEKTRFSDFDRWERATLGLESAQERVTDSEEMQIRSTRSLTIAENNLARANNQVVGTYINVGIQSLGLIASLPKLGGAFMGLLGPIGIAAAALGLIFVAVKDNEELQSQFKEVWGSLKELWIELQPIIENILVPALKLLAEFLIGILTIINDIINAVKIAVEWLRKMGEAGNIKDTVSSGRFAPGGLGAGMVIGKGLKLNDGIIKPDGTVIQTHPDDTLVAMKDIDRSVRGMNGGGGISVTITGPIYGINAQDISRALLRELSRKVTI